MTATTSTVFASLDTCFDFYYSERRRWIKESEEQLNGIGKAIKGITRVLGKDDKYKTEKLAELAFYTKDERTEAVNVIFSPYNFKHVYRLSSHLTPRLYNTTLDVFFHIEKGDLIASLDSQLNTGAKTYVRWALEDTRVGKKILKKEPLTREDLYELNTLSETAYKEVRNWRLKDLVNVFDKKLKSSKLGGRLVNNPEVDGVIAYAYPNGNRIWIKLSGLNGIDIYTAEGINESGVPYGLVKNANNPYTVAAKAFGLFGPSEPNSLDFVTLSKVRQYDENPSRVYSLPEDIMASIQRQNDKE